MFAEHAKLFKKCLPLRLISGVSFARVDVSILSKDVGVVVVIAGFDSFDVVVAK